ncbi:AbrB/MazE/SpoVT family DNA-binding domain-containing protein [Haloarcula salina]|uniref:AbrB/MazE/SpoVT family DNA-binding domain-containing protein n=1 Tax=Haloarcula salina TaxID=1429914 RepID=UPI003C6ECC5F
MKNKSEAVASGKEFTLKVDDSGRVMLPKEFRDHLGIDPNDEIRATLVGSVLELNPKQSSKLKTATAGRETWNNTTPIDAGEGLFGMRDD